MVACEVEPDPPSGFTEGLTQMDLFTQYAVVTAEMALKDAGLL